MIYLEGLKKVEKIPWKEIQPGMIFLGGIRINDTVPFELRNFPVLSPSLLDELTKKYCFLSRRDVLVVKTKIGYSPSKLSVKLLEAKAVLTKINAFRSAFLLEKAKVFKKYNLKVPKDRLFPETEFIDKRFLIIDEYNSFNNPYPNLTPERIPSFFHSLESPITLGHVLTRNFSLQFNLPMDENVLLHLVVDYSAGMEDGGKREIAFASIQLFYNFLRTILKNTEIKFYAFSHECKPVNYPFFGKEIPAKESHYSSFVKKVLHLKDKNRHNKVILFTDKEPIDSTDALHYGRLFKKNNIDYTQIIFSRTESIGSEVDKQGTNPLYGGCSQFAHVCGGNQIILKIHESAPILFLECYDRYIGLLTLLNPNYTQPEKIKQTVMVKEAENEVYSKGKIVKKWQPKKIKRIN